MSINATLFVQAIVFAILVWFTMSFVWPPIVKALDDRAKKIAEGLEAADKAKFELSAATRHVEVELAKTKTEVQSRVLDAEKRAQMIIEEAKITASEEAAKIIHGAHVEAEQEMVKARESLREQVALLAVKGAEQILRKEVNASVHNDLLIQLKSEL